MRRRTFIASFGAGTMLLAALTVVGGQQMPDPGELPIEQPTEIKLVINIRTTRALGFEIPPRLLIQATELIE